PLPLTPPERLFCPNDFPDARLDLFHTLSGEPPLVRKIVIEAFFDRWPDGELRGGEQVLDRLRHDVGAAVAVDLLALRHLEGYRTDLGVGRQGTREIHRLAIYQRRDRALG